MRSFVAHYESGPGTVHSTWKGAELPGRCWRSSQPWMWWAAGNAKSKACLQTRRARTAASCDPERLELDHDRTFGICWSSHQTSTSPGQLGWWRWWFIIDVVSQVQLLTAKSDGFATNHLQGFITVVDPAVSSPYLMVNKQLFMDKLVVVLVGSLLICHCTSTYYECCCTHVTCKCLISIFCLKEPLPGAQPAKSQLARGAGAGSATACDDPQMFARSLGRAALQALYRWCCCYMAGRWLHSRKLTWK